MKTIAELAAALAKGVTTAERLTEECLARIADPTGEGARAFIKVSANSARATAQQSDHLRAQGIVPSPLAGIPISIKDCLRWSWHQRPLRHTVKPMGSRAPTDSGWINLRRRSQRYRWHGSGDDRL